jgi:hypothetical protein
LSARGKEDSSFSEEKEAKRLLSIGCGATMRRVPQAQTDKGFLLLFFKKEESFLCAA